MEKMTRACASEAYLCLKQVRQQEGVFRLFVAHHPWQSDNRIVRHRKLWRGFEQDTGIRLNGKLPEVMVQSPQGVRFASSAEVEWDELLAVLGVLIDGVSTGQFAMVLVSTGSFLSQQTDVELMDHHVFSFRWIG